MTFNAGTEIDPAQLRRTWRASLSIGTLSFAAPFLLVLLLCRFALGWSWDAADIGGIALSTTSVAVIWAVAVETGLARTALGQLLISATFVTDLGTVLALSVLFITPTWWLFPFVLLSGGLVLSMRTLESWFFARYGARVIEPELKGAFAALLVIMWLAERAHAQAVLPAFILGFALAPTLARHRELQSRFRVVSFALLTPFFFLRAGLNVSLGLVLSDLGLLGLLLIAKLGAKTAAVYPLARHYTPARAWPVSLLVHRSHVRDYREPDRPFAWGDHRRPALGARVRRGAFCGGTDRHRPTSVPTTPRHRQRGAGARTGNRRRLRTAGG